ncbi:RNA dependent RNA polymerase-domain-containing protein [Trametes punicea]|nr:RNA dependent RNA polymerase-domain-containing protein [Trametes punicea]
MESDSENEFWDPSHTSPKERILAATRFLDQTKRVSSPSPQRSHRIVGSSGRPSIPPDQNARVGPVTGRHRGGERNDTIIDRSSTASAGKRPVHAEEKSDYSADTGSEDDSQVESLLASTESDSSLDPSKETSLTSVQAKSASSSITSLGSSASVDPVSGRKRTLEYENTFDTPIVPVTPSSKSVKQSKQFASTNVDTPSRSSTASSSRIREIKKALASSLPNTPIQPPSTVVPDSPTADRGKVETLTMVRACDSFDQSLGLRNSTTPDGFHIIAHDKKVQAMMDSMRIPWGAQYELARGVSCGSWSWADIAGNPARLESMRSRTNRDALTLMPQNFLRPPGVAASQPNLQLWAELDREELAICERGFRGLGLARQRGLGLQGEWEEAEGWYGGKIQQIARLDEAEGTLRLVLALMEMSRSTRFARFLGSRRILQISIPQAMRAGRADELKHFMTQKFVLCGRVFVAFAAKEDKVFLMETNEDYERGPQVPGDEQRMSLENFIAWHNPMDKNGKQPVSKWATRFDLGLSTSIPALSFQPANMFNIDDEVVHKVIGKKAPAEEIYTDGCGFMNGAALSAIGQRMGYPGRPTAVQGRIAGSKGVWMLHSSPSEQGLQGIPKIWTRESQRKILLDFDNLGPAHCIFDLVAPPRVIIPSRLSRLTVLNLSHNGVPKDILVELMKETLYEQVQALTQWTRPQDMQLLWATVNRIGHVTASRIQQYALGASRALGLSGRIREDEVPSDEPSDAIQELLDAVGDRELDEDEAAALLSEIESAGALPQRLRDQATGEPLTIHGSVMDLLQAGFHPTKLPVLYDKLKKIIMKVIEDVINDFHVSVPLSAEAFIVPDPYGALNEGEIHLKSTKDLKSPLEDLNPNIVLGEVLIYRNPVRVPSDVQKVIAVQHELLSSYTDVIVLPTKGPCSLASKLAGGDYDGDVCVCIYDPRIVRDFNNSPLCTAPPNFLSDNFEDQGKIEQVVNMAADMSHMAEGSDQRRKKLQAALLSDVFRPPIGAYSVFHENAAYSRGYDAPETIRNAFMFNTILDSRKTGLRVKDDVLRKDKRQYDKQRPECLQSSTKAFPEWLSCNNPVRLFRPPEFGPFILDELLEAGKATRDVLLSRYDKLKELAGFRDDKADDADLLRPYRNASLLIENPIFSSDLALIQGHVASHIKRWQRLAGESDSRTNSTPLRSRGRSARSARSGDQRKKWKDLAHSFASGPEIREDSPLLLVGDVAAIKASWAYAEKPKFAWTVAFQSLCRIKAMSQGAVAMAGHFADSMSMSSSAVRVLEQGRLGMS